MPYCMSCTPHWYYIGNTSQYEGFPEQDQGQPQAAPVANDADYC